MLQNDKTELIKKTFNEIIKSEETHPHKKLMHEVATSYFYKEISFQKKQIKNTKKTEDAPLVWVETKEDLNKMIKELKTEKEIGVDLEHHDMESYNGITCLIQISTEEKDFLIDTIKLKDSIVILSEIFEDYSIVKVFHGCAMDIKWLKKDCGIWTVNLFDTYYAAYILDIGGNSLMHLLSFFEGIKTDKKYQMTDWRIRPLSKEMTLYARTDTRYLVGIYKKLFNLLVEQKSYHLKYVLINSIKCAIRCSFKKLSIEKKCQEAYNVLLKKNKTNKACPFVFEKLYRLREGIAQEADKSPSFIISNQYLFLLSKKNLSEEKVLAFLSAKNNCQMLPYKENVLKILGKEIQIKTLKKE